MLKVRLEKRLGSFRLNTEFTCDNEKLALLGASGCGKSMTLKCIAGVERPDSGYIELNGRVLYDSARHIDLPPRKRGIGLMFQQYALFPHMTVRENLMLGAAALPRNARRDAAEEMLRRFRLEEAAELRPGRLSGGQQQRTALARCLIGRPELLLLDEPFSALDSYLKWQLELELLNTLEHYSGDVVLVSHDRDEVCRLADRVCVLTAGCSEPVQPVAGLMQCPGTVGAALISGCKNFSRAVADGKGGIRCEDWGVTLKSSHPLPEDLTFVGVRAHCCLPGEGENTLHCSVVREIDNVFSAIVMLATPGGSTGRSLLRMELDKDRWIGLGRPDTLTLHIAPEAVMPLTGGGL